MLVNASLSLSAHATMQMRRAKYARFRPSNAVLLSPRARWAFALRCVMFEVRDRRGSLRRQWPDIKAFAALRREYCGLWSRYLQRMGVSKPAKTAARVARLCELEHQLLPREVRLFRSLVDFQVTSSAQSTTNTAVIATNSTSNNKNSKSNNDSVNASQAESKTKKSSKRLKRFAGVVARRLHRNSSKNNSKKSIDNEDSDDDEKKNNINNIDTAVDGDKDATNDADDDDDDDVTLADVEQLFDGVNSNNSSNAIDAVTTSSSTATPTSNLRVTFELEHVSAKCVDKQTPLIELFSDEVTVCVDAANNQTSVAAKVRTFHVLDHCKGMGLSSYASKSPYKWFFFFI